MSRKVRCPVFVLVEYSSPTPYVAFREKAGFIVLSKAEDGFKNMIAALVVNWLGFPLAILFVYEWPLSEYFDEK